MKTSVRMNLELGLGLDISDKIRMVKVQKKKRWQVVDFASAELPAYVAETGIITNPEGLGEILNPMVKRMCGKEQAAFSNIPGPNVFFRTLALPRLPLNDLRKAAVFAASSFLPIPVEEAAISICPSRDYMDEEGAKTEVFLVAARRQQVISLKVACQIAGLNLAAVEIEPLSIQRYLQLDTGLSLEAYLYLHARRSSFCVFKDQVLQYQRYFDLDLSEERLSTLMKSRAIEEDESKECWEGEEIDAGLLSAEVITEIDRAIEYYRLQNEDSMPASIVLCGSLAEIRQLDQVLSVDIGIPVKKADLEPYISWPDRQVGTMVLPGEFAAAMGLALREVV